MMQWPLFFVYATLSNILSLIILFDRMAFVYKSKKQSPFDQSPAPFEHLIAPKEPASPSILRKNQL